MTCLSYFRLEEPFQRRKINARIIPPHVRCLATEELVVVEGLVVVEELATFTGGATEVTTRTVWTYGPIN